MKLPTRTFPRSVMSPEVELRLRVMPFSVKPSKPRVVAVRLSERVADGNEIGTMPFVNGPLVSLSEKVKPFE